MTAAFDGAGLIMDGPSLSCRDDGGSAALLLLHIRGCCVSVLLEDALQRRGHTWQPK